MKVLIKGQEASSDQDTMSLSSDTDVSDNTISKNIEQLHTERKSLIKQALSLPRDDPRRKELQQEAEKILMKIQGSINAEDAQYLALMY